MKWLKKILRIIAIILPCFIALSITTPSFAKSFELNTIPFARPNKNLYDQFLLNFSNTTYNAPSALYYTSTFESGKCQYDELVNGMSSSPTSLSYSIIYQFPDDTPSNNCRRLAPIPLSYYNADSIPSGMNSLYKIRDWDRYWYQYDGFYFLDSDTQNGLNRQSKLAFQDLFNPNMPDTFTNITLPLGLLTPEMDTLSLGSNIIVKGLYDIGATDTNDLDPNWGGTHYIEVKGFETQAYYESNQPTSFEIPCVLRTDSNPDYQIFSREFYCSTDVPISYDPTYPIGFTFKSRLSGDDYLWSMPIDFFVFNGITIITNGDTTSGGYFNPPVTGGDKLRAPGNILSPNTTETETNWFNSLIEMFAFNFTNPFSALFMLFTDNNSCVNIPNLAGMLHAEDTQYCPWFDSTTRNILTPVLGVSSVMLVFGFLVRWLGSSSGNMFDDETGGGALSKGTFVGRSRK